MQIHKYMAKILQFVYYMILFISLFLIAKNINGNIYFYHFQIFFFSFSSYTIFYLILVTLFYFVFSLQHSIATMLMIAHQVFGSPL